jgi:hypothetical protein
LKENQSILLLLICIHFGIEKPKSRRWRATKPLYDTKKKATTERALNLKQKHLLILNNDSESRRIIKSGF